MAFPGIDVLAACLPASEDAAQIAHPHREISRLDQYSLLGQQLSAGLPAPATTIFLGPVFLPSSGLRSAQATISMPLNNSGTSLK
jgi:hypothetical protein